MITKTRASGSAGFFTSVHHSPISLPEQFPAPWKAGLGLCLALAIERGACHFKHEC